MSSKAYHKDKPSQDTSHIASGPRPKSIVFAVFVSVVVVSAVIGMAGAVTITIGFEAYTEGQELTTQYRSDGVSFEAPENHSAGAIVKTCDPKDLDCFDARAGENAIVTPTIIAETPTASIEYRPRLVASFTEPQEEVWLYVRESVGREGTHIAELIARDDAGTVIAETQRQFTAATGWHRIAVSSSSAQITEVRLTLASEGNLDNPHNYFVVDDFSFYRNEQPRATFVVSPEKPKVDKRVRFDASESFDSDGEIVQYEWDFDGDGVFEQEMATSIASYTYSEPGRYSVTLRIVDGEGAVSETVSTIRVGGPLLPISGADLLLGGIGGLLGMGLLRKSRSIGHAALRKARSQSTRSDDSEQNQGPTAKIHYFPDEPAPGRPVLFDGSMSFDPDPGDRIVNYRWTIDGHEWMAPRFVHSFLKAGDYDVELTVVDNQGTVVTQTETVTVETDAGELVLNEVNPDAPGDDHKHRNQEYLVFENTGEEALNLDGWTIHDAAEADDRVTEGSHTFRFPDDFELAPNETVSVHTGNESETSLDRNEPRGDRHVFWGKDVAVWNNEEDIIVVEDDNDHPVMAIRYERTNTGGYELEKLDVEILEDWFPDIVVSERDEAPLVSINIDIQTGVAVVSTVIGILLGGTLLQGVREFFKSWLNITGFLVFATATWTLSTTNGVVSQTIPVIGPLILTLGAFAMAGIGGVGVLIQRMITWIRELVS